MKENYTLDNKCPSCGAQIIWDASKSKFRCDFCGKLCTFDELKKKRNKKIDKNNVSLNSFKCKNCGAEIISDDNNVSTFCIYCRSTAILKGKIESGVYPDYVIPFKKTIEEAKEAYINLLKGKRFLPKEFNNENNIENIKAIYIPFWAYDISADGNIDFDCEDRRTWEDDEYEYEEIKSYDVTINGHYEYEKLLCDASKSFSDDLMDSISPFKFEDLTDYDHAYLAGYLADKYDVEQSESYEIAKYRCKNSCVAKASTITGHGSDSYTGDTLKYVNKKTYYMYLPVLMLNTKFEDKIYTFAMNGQTGKIVGNLPIDKVKYTLFIIGLFIGTIAVMFGFVILILTLIGA